MVAVNCVPVVASGIVVHAADTMRYPMMKRVEEMSVRRE